MIVARRRRLVQAGVAGVAVLSVLGGAAAASAHRPGPTTLVQSAPRPSSTASAAPPGSTDPVVEGAKQKLSPADKAAHALWQKKGSKNYTISVVRVCFCAGGREPVTVTVRNGRVSPPADAGHGAMKSIDELFDTIMTRRADRFTVAYDSTYGFPTDVQFDYIATAIDDEVAYTITDYRPS